MPPLARASAPRSPRGPATVTVADPTFTDLRVFVGVPIPRGEASPPGQDVQVTRHDGNLSLITQGLAREAGGLQPGLGELALALDVPMTTDPAVWKRTTFQVRVNLAAGSPAANARVAVTIGHAVQKRTLRLSASEIVTPVGGLPTGSKEIVLEFGPIAPRRMRRVKIDGKDSLLLRVELRGVVDAGVPAGTPPNPALANAFLTIASIDARDGSPTVGNP